MTWPEAIVKIAGYFVVGSSLTVVVIFLFKFLAGLDEFPLDSKKKDKK